MIGSGTVACTPCGDQAFLRMRSELPTLISSKETICKAHRVRKQNGWDARVRNPQGKKIFAGVVGGMLTMSVVQACAMQFCRNASRSIGLRLPDCRCFFFREK